MTRTFLHWHLGMGDGLLCAGLVRSLVKHGHHLVLPVYRRNKASLRALFSDILDVVEFVEVNDESAWSHEAEMESKSCENKVELGYFVKGPFNIEQFDREFYRHAGVPFLDKWREFKLPEEAYGNDHVLSPIFVHDDPSRGYIIPLEGRRPRQMPTIFHEARAIMAAEEIHCISSCFAILADLLAAPGKKFLHRYARPDGCALPIFGEHWVELRSADEYK